MKRLFRLLLLRPNSLWLLFKTFILLGLIRLGLWQLSFANLRKFLTFFSHRISANSDRQVKVDCIVWAVNKSSQYMPGVKCLARALTTEVLMNQYGHQPQLRIGVAKRRGKLEAHAWVESQGQVLIGQLQDLSQFSVLPLPCMEKQQ